MDKFTNLIGQIGSLINSLENNITVKQTELETIASKLQEIDSSKSLLENDLAEVLRNLNLLKEIDGVFIPKKAFIVTFKSLFCSLIKKSPLIDKIMLLIILPLAAPFVLLLALLLAILTMVLMYNHRKKYSISSLEIEEKNLRDNISQLEKQRDGLLQQKENITTEKNTLEEEKKVFNGYLTRVMLDRVTAVETLIREEDLNREFPTEAFGDIIKRVREKEQSLGGR